MHAILHTLQAAFLNEAGGQAPRQMQFPTVRYSYFSTLKAHTNRNRYSIQTFLPLREDIHNRDRSVR